MKYCVVMLMLGTVLVRPGYAQDTVQVSAGWNIIGSVKAGAVPDVLSTIPDSLISSSFWGYAPGVGYESTDTLENGVGYWVKVKDDGVIVFNTTPAIDSCKARAFIDQGKLYHTVLIGDQCWMAENLDVGVMVDSVQNATDNDTIEKYCFRNDPLNCALYDGLYQWNEAMQYVTSEGTQGICPAGWHIPTEEEFQTLYSAIGGYGNALKTIGQGTGGGAGTNSSGFSALLGGEKSYSSFSNLGIFAKFWTSTYSASMIAYAIRLFEDQGDIQLLIENIHWGLSLRCLED